MSNEFINGRSDHVGVVAFGEDTDVAREGEHGKVAGYDGAGVEEGETCGVEAEGSDGVGDSL